MTARKKADRAIRRGGRFAAVPGRCLRDRAMTPKLREVLLSVCYYAAVDGRCVVRVGTLAAPTGTDERNMRGYLSRLEDLGYIEITKRASDIDGRQLASAYRVIYDADIPADRDRAAAGENVHVDLDEVAAEDVEITAGDDGSPPGQSSPQGGGSDYQGVMAVTTTRGGGGDYHPSKGTTFSPSNTTPPTPPAVAGGASDDHSPDDEPITVDSIWAVYVAARMARLGSRSTGGTLSAIRRRLIESRIRTHGAGAVEAAVRGWVHDDWVCGLNDAGKVYADLEFVLRVNRQGDHVQRFADLLADAESGELDRRRESAEQQPRRASRDDDRLARIARLDEFAGGDTPRQITGGAA